MKNKISVQLFFITILAGGVLYSAPITEGEAKNVALNYIYKKNYKFKNTQVKEFKIKDIIDESKLLKKNIISIDDYLENPTIRLVRIEPQGWVLVSGDDTQEPIIGYSLENNIDNSNLPPQLEKLLESYVKKVKDIRVKGTKPKISISSEWKELLKEPERFKNEFKYVNVNAKSTYWRLTKDVDLDTPLWNQCNYYNTLTPIDSTSVCGNSRVPTGCAATVLAELARFHRWPNRADGLISYSDNNRYGMQNAYGLINVQNNNHNYNWNAMPMNNLTSLNNEVATLMHHAGIAEEMDYGFQGSGTGVADVNNALINNFSYRTYGVESKSSYSSIYHWYQKIKTDLRQGFPVMYAGWGTGGAHIFMIDGFDVDGNEFQINWGWGGSFNGNFQLSSLEPSKYNFNSTQVAILGIKPNNLHDNYEPDDGWQTSSLMSVGGHDGRKNNHSINPINDQDWITFWNPVNNQNVTIETLNSAGDTRMWLYDKNGNQIAYNDDGGVGTLSKITKTLNSGTYYIKIDEYGNNNIISSYDIEIKN